MSNAPFWIKIRLKGPHGEVEFEHQRSHVEGASIVRENCVEQALTLYKGIAKKDTPTTSTST